MDESRSTSPNGVLVVDKPEGPTSHDIVSRVRRALRTRRVGHAGTLDPMATGILVVLVGEATKLEPYLAASRKAYVAEITFGRATDTLDRLGETLEEQLVPEWLSEELDLVAVSASRRSLGGPPVSECERLAALGAIRLSGALSAELARESQIPPRFSAIKVDGQKSYDRARRGESFELAARDVRLLEARLLDASGPAASLRVEMNVTKGYYVRSFARDLGLALGVPSHLTALRRIGSGKLTLDSAVSSDASSDTMLERLVPLAEAARANMESSQLTRRGVFRAERGQPLETDDFDCTPTTGAWFDAGRLVAIGTFDGDGIGRVQRGFVAPIEVPTDLPPDGTLSMG